jgi:predicted DNA-binding protein YlxM (UPF0122 family)
MNDPLIESVRSVYAACGSIRATASVLHISDQKARKILISLGEYTTPLISHVNEMYENGASLEEIANETNLTRNCILSMIPYAKGAYGLAYPTENAKRIRECRKRKETK